MNTRFRGIRVDRRTTLKWLAATMAATAGACSRDEKFQGDEIPPAPTAKGRPGNIYRSSAGYGTDPDLLNPVVPWPRTLTEAQLSITAALADMILPEDERSPAASAVGVHDFIDEWVSAPYPQQQEDREIVLAGLEWLDRQSTQRFGTTFDSAGEEQKGLLLQRLTQTARAADESHPEPRFFHRFRFLAVGAFYTTEAGMADVGYIGNVPLSGSYPGPSHEAMAHLAGVLRQLGLRLPG